MSKFAAKARELAIQAQPISHNFALKLQAELEVAHAAGRREALEEAAKIADEQISAAGKVWGWCAEEIRNQIRALPGGEQ